MDLTKVTHNFLPKQGEIDRLINQINKKVLRDSKLSMNLRDLKAAYLTSPLFRDIYLNLTQNKVPLGKGAAKRLEQNARNYMILDGLLFKIIELDDGSVRCNLAMHCSVTPFVIQQPIQKPRLLDRVYKPMHTLY